MNEPEPSTPPDDELHAIGDSGTHLHPRAPLVFIAAGLVIGIGAWLVWNPVIAVPLGLFGGGLGVWALERGRRLLGRA